MYFKHTQITIPVGATDTSSTFEGKRGGSDGGIGAVLYQIVQ